MEALINYIESLTLLGVIAWLAIIVGIGDWILEVIKELKKK